MDKKAFALVRQFIRSKPWVILGMIALMLALTFGERALSDTLRSAELQFVDYGIAAIRMLLQTGLSVVLVYAFHKQRIPDVSLAAVDIIKLFFTGVLVSFVEALCLVAGLIPLFLLSLGSMPPWTGVLFLLVPLGVWLFLRLDFAMNVYITGRDPRMFSCIRTSFRASRGHTARYLLYNIKYLLFYFVIELLLVAAAPQAGMGEMSEALVNGIDIFDAVFLSVFMPYRFLLKCGFYEVYLQEEKAHG